MSTAIKGDILIFFSVSPTVSSAAALRCPVDRRGTHPKQVGDGAASVPADLQGKVGKGLLSASGLGFVLKQTALTDGCSNGRLCCHSCKFQLSYR